ncbi:hypothetical protein F66182_891 [Fusarium sp. NRRL 66182]|nr:hypothetical protein F66182_891 [Fusarium sp. NRRL 66182]
MDTLGDKWPRSTRKAVRPLEVIIVGAGIGGLTAGISLSQSGHSVMILERVDKIDEIGAGIQLAPNASRILNRLGVLEEVMDYATVLERVSIRRYCSDDELSTVPLMPSTGLRYGAPSSVIHRGDLQTVLLRAATNAGCQILTSQTVIAVDPEFAATVQARNSKTGDLAWFHGDLLIAADGIKSCIRQQMAISDGFYDEPVCTGNAAYRLLVPIDKVEHDPMLSGMLGENVAMRYMGPGGHVMAYPLQNNTAYNLVLVHPAKAGNKADGWTTRGDRQEMLDFYQNWSPAIRKWLELADQDVMEWNLYSYRPIPRWSKGSTALIGDSCHPMLPFVAQGAANAIEDAAVLATALTCTADIKLALMMYEVIRKDRGEQIAASASKTAHTLHLPDGPEQRDRDEAMVNSTHNPDRWSNIQWQDYMYGVDVMKDTLNLWRAMSERTMTRGRQVNL